MNAIEYQQNVPQFKFRSPRQFHFIPETQFVSLHFIESRKSHHFHSKRHYTHHLRRPFHFQNSYRVYQ